MTMIPFPSINQFRHVVANVRRKASFMGLDDAGEPIYDPAAKSPALTFIGTVKLHGTNAAVVFHPDHVCFQSRERVLNAEADNMGFYAHMSQQAESLEKLRQHIKDSYHSFKTDTVAVYGEWCGGNIQKGVAITGLPKMFVIFAMKINDQWLTTTFEDPEAGIYNILNFPLFTVNVDFNQPEVAQNILASITEQVEACCPVGQKFGVTGIGEGVVWRCVENPSSELWFKVKGEKHSVSKVKTLASVDVEALTKQRDFVESVVTEARLEQGMQNLLNEQNKPFEMASLGDFIRWVHGDVMKEEADTIEANNLNPKNLGGPIAKIAKDWFVNRLNVEVMSTKV